MKVGLITLYKNNYGSILQCFSTKTFIENYLNGTCDVLQIVERSFLQKIHNKVVFIIKSLRYITLFFNTRKSRNAIRADKNNLVNRSLDLMNFFIKTFIRPVMTDRFNLSKKSWLDQYDFFITGSDQIWNVFCNTSPFVFLQFASSQKRIALATSFGVSEIPLYNQKMVHNALNGFNFISVREETGEEIVKKYSNTKVCRIADPTFIYDADEWRNFAKEVVVPSKKYILVHFLNEPNEVALESMVWLSEQLNLDVIALGYKYDGFNSLKRFVYMDGGPWEYVSMIDHAEFVLTDSFHSSLFSINFNKRFFVFHRNYSASKQTSRISDLLKRFGMENRLIENIDTLKKIYLKNHPAETRNILENERTTIRDYIQKSITGQIPQCFLDEYGKK